MPIQHIHNSVSLNYVVSDKSYQFEPIKGRVARNGAHGNVKAQSAFAGSGELHECW